MPDSEPDDDAADLRARVRDLEATVSEQQATIQKLMPSRRQTIAGLGLLGAGAGVGRLSTERARAQAAGQVGTDTDPVGLKAWDLDVQNGATFNGSDLLDVGTAEVEDAEITDETLIVSDGLESDQTISAASWEKLTGWEIDTDERGEFDSADDEFSPDKDGYYFVSFRARFNGGGSEELRSFRLRNETDVGSVAFVFNSNTNPNYTKIFSEVVFLDSDNDYSFQVRNENSSDEIQAASTNTSFSVRSVFRGG